MSCRHIRLSNGSEAFIARITASGPAPKRPPHIAFDGGVDFSGLEPDLRALIALLPVLLVTACDKQSAPPPQPRAQETAPRPTRVGFDESQRGTAAPATPFTAPDGKSVTLASFRGQPVLVNLWATWCGPCVKEMPGLDRLAGRMKGKLAVLAINQMDAPEKAAAWWTDRGLKNLRPYAEPDGKLSSDFGSGMLPTTILFDAQGREVWRVVGEMDWDSAAAAARVK
jgi:thiol-disulfide isomerase/thioredoxin